MKYLQEKKILILAPELENNEHRGIASYTKALIEALSDSGAEIWLTTSTNLRDLKIKRLKFLKPVEGRGLSHIIYINKKKIKLIDESYNASPQSMKICVDYFKKIATPLLRLN